MTSALLPDSDESAASRQRLRHQLEKWRADLLQIDSRQRLVYFKHSRSASLELRVPDLANLVQSVTDRVVPFEAADEAAARGSHVSDARALVATNKTGAELDRGLKRLASVSTQTLADRGFWNLYLGVGMLEWRDGADVPVSSPLLLIPVRLERSSAAQRYRMRRTVEEIAVNPALGLKLEQDHQLTPPGVDAFDVDVEDYLDEMRKTVTAAGRQWTVANRVVLTTFSFHKEAIFRDLRDNADTVVDRPLVELLALGPDARSAGEWGFAPARDDLDAAVPPEELHSILDADATQRRCILAARAGYSFVMDGPPGTGKSQTITNVVAELITAGKTVLFVSEKAAALDVVRNRLRGRGLAPFLLELHDVNTTRKQVATTLADALSKRPVAAESDARTDVAALRVLRLHTTDHSRAMNEHRPGLEMTLASAIGRLAALDHVPDLPVQAPEVARYLDSTSLTRSIDVAGSLARSWRPAVEGSSFLWRGLDVSSPLHAARQELPELARAAAFAGRALVDRLAASDEDLGLMSADTVEASRRREHLLGLFDGRRRAAAPQWLTVDDLGPVRQCLAETERRDGELTALITGVEQQMGDSWSRLDPDRTAAVRSLTEPDVHSEGFSGARGSTELTQLKLLLMSTPGLFVELREDVERLAYLLGVPRGRDVSLSRAFELAALAHVRRSPSLPEASWLDPSVQDHLDHSASVLARSVECVVDHQRALAEVFTPAVLALDTHGLAYRFGEVHTGLRRWSRTCREDRAALKAVSVSGRVDRRLLASLGGALAWQQSEQQLRRDEDRLATVLGCRYRGTDTDFVGLREAVEAAHRVVSLAGDDLNRGALGRQLASPATTDPALLTTADRVQRVLGGWMTALRPLIAEAEFSTIVRATVADAAQWCRLMLDQRTAGLEALEHVSDVVGRSVTITEAFGLLDSTGQITGRLVQLEEQHDATRALLGGGYRQRETAWDDLREELAWADTVRTAVGGPLPSSTADRLAEPSLSAGDVAAAADDWSRAASRLTARFSPPRRGELATLLEGSLREAVEHLAEMVQAAPRDVVAWYAFTEALTTMTRLGLDRQTAALRELATPADVVAPALEATLLRSWIQVVEHDDAARLGSYRSDERQHAVDRFAELDASHVAHAHAGVIAACADRRPVALDSRAARLLQRQGQLKSRHKPIRELLDETFSVVVALKPVFMMSPVTVSQFIPPTARFDVVIFDEASQVVPGDAINCVYRGRQLVVAGDQKQLPPTTFFQRTAEDDDDEETDDFDSLLDLCKGAGGLQSLPLEWHYRSRHEDLIAFSNHRFYQGALETFPGAVSSAPDLGVVAFTVPGVYARGGTADNPIEAHAVVDRVLAHRHQHPDLSIGVVTLSSRQADAVLEALEERALTEPLIDELLTDQGRLDGFFVKNLESVQGDERDVIILSIGYGPDADGRLSLNFGPINRPAGWRRLNVAITRARRRVEVVKSFAAGDLGTTTSVPVGHLQAYLRFAETRQVESAVDVPRDRPVSDAGGLQDAVAQAIRDLGYDVVTDVGAAGYRIAVAVRRPGHEDEFALAVELDGPVYDAAETARDRDRLRTSVLHGLGWRTHRVWGSAWLADRTGEVDRLRRAIEEAPAQQDDTSATETPVRPSEEALRALTPVLPAAARPRALAADTPAWASPYVRQLSGVPRHADPTSVDARPRLREHLCVLIDLESPVHEDVLLTSLRDEWGVGRLTAELRANARESLRGARLGGRRVIRDTLNFFRVEGRAVTDVRTPTPVVQRTVAHVAPDELDLAMLLAVTEASRISGAELKARVATVFGWSMESSQTYAALRASLLRLSASSRLHQSSSDDVGLIDSAA